ncbi:MAG: hypothetical protein HZA93_02185 [Verrucomicrobia bacterium]|nr:hypothetical protein [Verrucomicrobiota bacterium]
MKTKPAILAALLAAVVPALAAPLAGTTAVHTKPDDASPAITFLKAGTDPVPAPGTVASTPAGWVAIELPGPFEGYVINKDLNKSLDIIPGAKIHLAPKESAGVLTLAEKNDKTKITGLHGKWTQIRLERTLIGYVNIGGAPGYVPPIATATAGGSATPPPAEAALSPAPVAPGVYGTAAPGQPAPTIAAADSASTLPRQFAGKFVSTQSPFRPRRPFDWALNDDAGKRYAYLDVSKLLLTEQIEKYVGHKVVVFGTARGSADGKDIVITIETLQLK